MARAHVPEPRVELIGPGAYASPGGLSKSGRILLLDKGLGVTAASASVDPDLSTWTPTGLASVTGTGPYTTTEDGSTGNHKLVSTSGAQLNHPVRLSAKLRRAVGARNVRLQCAPEWAVFDLGTGAVLAASANATPYAAGPDPDGFWSLAVETDQHTSDTTQMYMADGTSVSYPGDGASALDWQDVAVSQVRGVDWTGQSPGIGSPQVLPVFSQPDVAEQPYYGDGAAGMEFDGVDDWLRCTTGLGSHTSHTIMLVVQLPALLGERYVFDAQLGRLAFGRHAGDLGVYSPAGWNTLVSGAASALPLSVVTLLLDAVTGTMGMRINGVAAPLTAATYSPVGLDGTVSLGASIAGAATAKASVYGVAAWDHVLVSELERNERWLARRHGVPV